MRGALNLLIVFLIAACFTVLTGGGQALSEPVTSVQKEAEQGKYQLINADKLWKLYQDSSHPPLLIDTRQDWEYRTGHIKDAIHFSMEPTWFARLTQRLALADNLGLDKNRILVFY